MKLRQDRGRGVSALITGCNMHVSSLGLLPALEPFVDDAVASMSLWAPVGQGPFF